MYGGKFAFQNQLGQLVVGRKFTIFCFVLLFESKFHVQAPRGAYIRRGDLTEGFLRYDFEGLIFGRAYTWRGLLLEFYNILHINLCYRKLIKKCANVQLNGIPSQDQHFSQTLHILLDWASCGSLESLPLLPFVIILDTDPSYLKKFCNTAIIAVL